MVHCTINLENNTYAVYRAGDTLQGTIELFLEQPKKFRGFYFVLNGRAKCHWTETRRHTSGSGKNRRTRSRTVHFEGKNVYLNAKTYLFGAPGAEATEIESGTHRFNFTCQLPPMIPGSFEGSYGNIRYHIEAVLDVPWGFDKEYKVQFTVVQLEDLNNDPGLSIAVQNEESKTFCCLFCESDPLFMTVTIPYSGFTPGQIIPVTVKYNNKSNVEIDYTRISLVKVVKFNSERHIIKLKLKLIEFPICHNLEIPSAAVCSNSKFCNVVQVMYMVEVEAGVLGCHSGLTHKIPITIGSIPLRMSLGNGENVPSTSASGPFPSAPIVDQSEQKPPSAPEFDLPPSFEEALKIAPNVQPSLSSHGETSNVGWSVSQNIPSAPEKQ
ncbi:CLUMA_CG012199, isoform A [Clunio marinus]|uniref:CLUMA_CG012199, isoform A n=1 Tax=Clunio marinus TaxID=568069 RepID=A0A1J1IE96_9DIPT|nr:CLUMA_CG012199, isoform A [Clunio marinus]